MFLSRAKPVAKGVYRALPGIWSSEMDRYLRNRYRNRPPTRIDVMTSFSGRNLDALQVLLQSLSETHPHDEIVFWLFEQSIPEASVLKLSGFCENLGNVTLRPIKVAETTSFDRLKTLGGKPDSARFLWLVAHQYLPDDLKRIIYLDALDIIVTDDLVPLQNHPFLGKYLVACRERTDLPPLLVGPAPRAVDLGLPFPAVKHMSRGLMNSGAIVLNLEKFRRDDIDIGTYLKIAEWAHDELDLPFGDQGLFSLTHGSHYIRAHDRYNYRFYMESRDGVVRRPAVIHYAGSGFKPLRWRLTAELEQLVLEHLNRTGRTTLRLNSHRPLRAMDLPYLRMWWEICARTPCFGQIAPQATQRMSAALARAGLNAE